MSTVSIVSNDQISRAQGCLLGQLAGDALGSLVEFETPEQIRHEYPEGVRELADGGTWNTLAGQPTDDSEMALALARMLVTHKKYDSGEARKAYVSWLQSNPFDCGNTVRSGLQGRANMESQANGALMRVSPLGIFGATSDLASVAAWAQEDCLLTHPHPVCRQANALFATAIAYAISAGCGNIELYDAIVGWARSLKAEQILLNTIQEAKLVPPRDYMHNQGWVLTAFHNALWQLLNASSLSQGVVDTVSCGGDTDTNAAICGALLGAVYGQDRIPKQWRVALQACRPTPENPRVRHPRPECYWPVDATELAEQLIRCGPAFHSSANPAGSVN